jgi:hypothetical protein
VTADLLDTLAAALEIGIATVERLIEQDRHEALRAWEAWGSEPVPIRLIVKYLPAVYGTVPLPQEITTPEQAEAFACVYAKKNRRKVCLALSRRHSVWIDKDGQVYARTEATPHDPNVPFMRLKGSGTRFLMRFGELRKSYSCTAGRRTTARNRHFFSPWATRCCRRGRPADFPPTRYPGPNYNWLEWCHGPPNSFWAHPAP